MGCTGGGYKDEILLSKAAILTQPVSMKLQFGRENQADP